MDEKIRQLEAQLKTITERNQRVELDKAWETSWFRILTIMAITYVIAAWFMFAIGVASFYLSALVPVIGYCLSAQSLPIIKKWWLAKRFK